MAKGDITIPINTETKAFRQGIESGVIKPLQDAEGELEKLGTNRGPEQLEADLKGAQTATERLGKQTKDEADRIEKNFRDAYRQSANHAKDFEGDVRKTGEKVGETSEAVGGELRQNIGETFSSFRGDITDFGQIAQDTLGGLATEFGGLLGPIAAAAGAAGIGLILGALDQAKQRQAEVNQEAADWAQAYIDSADKIVTASDIVGKVQEITTDPDQYKQAEKNAKNWGVTVSTAMLAMAGDTVSLTAAQQGLADQQKKLDDVVAGSSYKGWIGDVAELENKVDNGKKSLDVLTGSQQQGKKQADEYADALAQLATHTDGATRSTDKLGDSIYTMPDGKQILISADTGVATDNVDEITKRVGEVPTEHKVKFTSDTTALEQAAAAIKNGKPIEQPVVFVPDTSQVAHAAAQIRVGRGYLR